MSLRSPYAFAPRRTAFRNRSQISPIRTISVSGSADIKINPDLIYINLGIETRRPNLDTAKSDNDQSVLKLLAFLRDYGIASKGIQTGILTINPVFSNYEENNIKYYSVVKTFSITMHSAAAIDKLISGCITNGATNIYGIDFRTSELKKYREQARDLAIKAAKEKAEKLSSALGVQLGAVHTISENSFGGSFYWYPGYSFNRSTGGSQVVRSYGNAEPDTNTTVMIGEIPVSASVNVTFKLN
ncbi:MAG: SIMPL domain-containing protein [Holophagaceae bacterium]|nr:SIMPL domain-containing protein [Holophagaceae bacterium]